MRSSILLASAFMLAAPSLTRAQGAQRTGADARWTPWLGCWQPEPSRTATGAALMPLGDAGRTPLVCVTPVAGTSAVDIATIANGKIVARDRIDATGQQRPRTANGCTGWERAEWSADARRVYLRSQDVCPGGLTRTSSGVLAMAPGGEWLDVQGVSTGGHPAVRVIRYRDAGAPAGLPPEIAAALAGRSNVATARAVSDAPLGTADVVDASHHVDPAVVAAWLVEQGQRFALDAKTLVALADAGVPGEVTDAMVAVSYPKSFALNPSSGAADLALGQAGVSTTTAYRATGRTIPVFADPYGYDPYDLYSPYYGYSRYGYSPYGYLPYGYGPGYGWYLGGAPVIVLKGTGTQQPTTHGRVVNGHGYTQDVGGTETGRTAHASPASEPPRSSDRGSSSSSNSSQSSGGGRTAHQRP